MWKWIRSDSSSAGKKSDPSELNIVLIGGRRPDELNGKSSVGNIILGREAFRTNALTSQSVMRQELVSGRQVSVVDTPGWWSTQPLDLTPKLTQLEIQRSVSLCPPGPHAFVLVVRLDLPYAGTGMSAEEHVRFLLSDTVWKRTIVVFTVADKNNMDTDLIRSNHQLRYLTEKCEGRFHVLDISDRGDGGQVTELLQKVDQIVQSNGGHYETEEHVSEELKEKERSIRRRAEQRRKDAQKQPTEPPLGRGSSERGRTDLRIVVLGREDSGKSSAGNTILTGSGFKADQRSAQCEVRQGSVAGRQVTVVDSPGWFYNRPLQDTSEMDSLEIQDSVCLCPPGPHAVLLAVPLYEAFTKEMRVAVEEHMSLLPQSLWSHSIALFTFGDLLGERSIEQHIEAEGEDLRWLLDRCGNRYHVFNNQKREDSQVTQLLEKIDEMLSGNTGGHCEVENMSARKWNMEERVQTLTRKLTALKALCEGEHQSLSDVRVVLAGGKQDERNGAGNLILQQNVFNETRYKEFKTQPKLTECVRQQRRVADRTVSVVMCPDWSTTPPSQKDKDVLLHGVTLCSPGPHAVLVMVDVESSFCEADRRSVEEHMELLGDTVWRHALVLFMWGVWLGGRRVEEYIESEGEPLRRILEKCGYRYHVLRGNNWDISEVTQLMEKTDDMVTRNGGHFKRDESSRVTAAAARLSTGLNTGGVMQVAGQTTPFLPEEQSLPNTEPDSDLVEDEYYTLTHTPRGTCLIINNEIFTVDELNDRPGTLKDQEELRKVFFKLGFEVETHSDQTADDIRRVLKELGGGDFSEADALVVCVLSHGDMGCVLGSDGEKVSLRELTQPFRSRNAPTLAGKPKLFFIQACQGSDYQRGELLPPPTPSGGQGDTLQEDSVSLPQDEMVPNDADFLMGMSTVEECKSFRHIKKGSFYIQELCEQLERRAVRGEDIVRVLTAVNREVGSRRLNTYKQMPDIRRNTLTKTLVLKFI